MPILFNQFFNKGPRKLTTPLPTAPPLKPFCSVDFGQSRPRRQAGESTVAVNLLLTVLSVAPPLLIARAPLYTQRVAPKAQREFIAPNLLCTPGLKPPFRPLDWQTPARGVKRVDDPALNLLGATLAPTGVVPFGQSDWSSPAVARRLRWDDPQNLLGTVLAPVTGAAPFSQSDWTIPTAIRRLPQGEPQSFILTLLGPAPEAAPFNQEDWSTPTRRVARADDALQNFLTLGIPPVPPILPFDWPTPQKRAARQADEFPNLLGTTLAPIGQAPFTSFDYGKPSARVAQRVDAAQNLLLTPGLAPPFVPVDLPGSTRRVALQADVPQNLLGATLAPQAAIPFVQTDWPFPRLAERAVQTEIQNLFGTTLTPVILPGGTLNIMTSPWIYNQAHLILNTRQTSGVGAPQTITIPGVPKERITVRSIFAFSSIAGGSAITIQDGATIVVDLGTVALTIAAAGVLGFLFTASPGNDVVVNVGAVAGATTTVSVIADADSG